MQVRSWMEEDQNYIFEYLSMFQEFEIKTVYIHCRNGVLNLDTKKIEQFLK